MCMSSSEEERPQETLGEFFDKNYTTVLRFLPQRDQATMATLDQRWHQRVEAFKIWNDLMQTVKGKSPEKEQIKKVLKKDEKVKEISEKPKAKNIAEVKASTTKIQKPQTVVISNSKKSMPIYTHFPPNLLLSPLIPSFHSYHDI